MKYQTSMIRQMIRNAWKAFSQAADYAYNLEMNKLQGEGSRVGYQDGYYETMFDMYQEYMEDLKIPTFKVASKWLKCASKEIDRISSISTY